MAICGSECTINSGLSAVEGHRFVIELGSNEIDIRTFGDGDYGSFIACALNGTLVVDSYLRPVVDVGDSLTVKAVVGTETISLPCVVTGQTINVDAKDVVQFNTKFRVQNTVSITP